MDLSVVVPVYRSKDLLPELYRRLNRTLPKITSSYEMLFVDDGSRDGSWEVLQRIARTDRHVRAFKLSKNFGQHAATLCGIRQSGGKYIVTLDDDLEHPPEAIPQLLQKARQGWDLVYGVFPQRTHPGWRNLTSEVARFLFRLAIPKLNDTYSSFRVIQREPAQALDRFESPFPFVDGYLSWVTNNCATVEVPHGQRGNGSSHYTFRKLLRHTINIFVTFSDLPLRLATWLGLVVLLLGFFWVVFILVGHWTGYITMSGYSSLMAGITVFSGTQLMMLGVFGEYIGRINFTTSRKPLYLISQREEPRHPSSRKYP